ncbi:anti-sigma B factor RsbW [Rummeliibacillus sp. G93]|uniref:Serine-protein kinase RsbW n=1 Tax=Rummeliibacillus stabekisii TaxID=241244 RepID=A0A143HFA9_9BACL|nr:MULTISPECIES: anti-sigma B factor RsbW [Rummeliibacillus]AMX00166.1 anti-sigma B factor RsbW [Rummeliibacillus stabekisii]MBB5171530.1 serine/threonine-protein kinase RsbW [Rummeliibacillus stabekisii]MCM3317737.1 anti-sigma B factor RsbW [Rummeliibacillus stabekisii]UQW97078.1 anti-sigma B factor RsbW [Rummeliibacillus sp. G93]GEL05838.1 serine-protein kinase RsbW [Rummeliibacillus stabekisii]
MREFDYMEMRVPAKTQYVGVARLAISGLANRVGFSYDDIEDVKIAASEAITNAIQHAYADKEDGEVVIGCALYKDKMEIMVADYGRSFKFEEVKEKVGPYHEEEDVQFIREGGLGLYLIESLMDEVKVLNDNGVTVFMTKFVSREQVNDHAETISF